MVTIDTIRQPRSAAAAGNDALDGARLAMRTRAVFRRLGAMAQRRRGRRALLDMTDDQLRDIGVSRDAARREGIRAFWD